MDALFEQFGRPDRVVTQSMREIMQGPAIQSSDIAGFRRFALKVRALVATLPKYGSAGQAELRGITRTSELMTKMSSDLQVGFRRYLLR